MELKLPLLFLSVSSGMALSAATLTYDTIARGAWGDASSWKEGAAPAAGDTLVVPGDARLTDADAAAVAEIAQLTVAADATLTVENEETVSVGGFVSGEGRLVKLGAGMLAYTRSDVPTVGGGGRCRVLPSPGRDGHLERDHPLPPECRERQGLASGADDRPGSGHA